MARRMHALRAAHSVTASQTAVPLLAREGGPDRLLRFAIHAVFGTPFLGSAVLLVRSQLWPGRNHMLDAMGLNIGSAWADVVALGLLWTGVSQLLLTPGRRRSGAVLLLGGALLLFGGQIFTTS